MFVYLLVRDNLSVPFLPVAMSTELVMLTMLHCRFEKLGGNVGGSLYAEKINFGLGYA